MEKDQKKGQRKHKKTGRRNNEVMEVEDDEPSGQEDGIRHGLESGPQLETDPRAYRDAQLPGLGCRRGHSTAAHSDQLGRKRCHGLGGGEKTYIKAYCALLQIASACQQGADLANRPPQGYGSALLRTHIRRAWRGQLEQDALAMMHMEMEPVVGKAT